MRGEQGVNSGRVCVLGELFLTKRHFFDINCGAFGRFPFPCFRQEREREAATGPNRVSVSQPTTFPAFRDNKDLLAHPPRPTGHPLPHRRCRSEDRRHHPPTGHHPRERPLAALAGRRRARGLRRHGGCRRHRVLHRARAALDPLCPHGWLTRKLLRSASHERHPRPPLAALRPGVAAA